MALLAKVDKSCLKVGVSIKKGTPKTIKSGWWFRKFDCLDQFATQHKKQIQSADWNLSAIRWSGGERVGANFISSKLCMVDFDNGQETIDSVRDKLGDLNYLICTSKSHLKPKHDEPACERFHVLINCSRDMLPEEHVLIHRCLYSTEFMNADACTFDLARYFGCADDCLVICQQSDTLLDIDEILIKAKELTGFREGKKSRKKIGKASKPKKKIDGDRANHLITKAVEREHRRRMKYDRNYSVQHTWQQIFLCVLYACAFSRNVDVLAASLLDCDFVSDWHARHPTNENQWSTTIENAVAAYIAMAEADSVALKKITSEGF